MYFKRKIIMFISPILSVLLKIYEFMCFLNSERLQRIFGSTDVLNNDQPDTLRHLLLKLASKKCPGLQVIGAFSTLLWRGWNLVGACSGSVVFFAKITRNETPYTKNVHITIRRIAFRIDIFKVCGKFFGDFSMYVIVPVWRLKYNWEAVWIVTHHILLLWSTIIKRDKNKLSQGLLIRRYDLYSFGVNF